MSTFDATELIKKGYTFVDVSQDIVERARDEYLRLIEVNKARRLEDISAIRSGEREPDLGLIFKDGRNSDYKYYLHYAHDWPQYVGSRLGVALPRQLRRLYSHNSMLSVMIVRTLARTYPTLFPASVVQSMIKACCESVTYGTPILRGLYYPADAGGAVQTGAKGHYDRSFLTIHLGDTGGELVAHAHEDDMVGTAISPPPGKAVVFFGVKAAILTRNLIKPLWHSSRTVPGADRTAMVYFAHIDVGEPVIHAGATYREFIARLSD